MLSLGEGIPFDTSVGEAVRDAQGNKVYLYSGNIFVSKSRPGTLTLELAMLS